MTEFINIFKTRKAKMGVGIVIGLVIVGIITILIMAQLARKGAAEIFNREIKKQKMLRVP